MPKLVVMTLVVMTHKTSVVMTLIDRDDLANFSSLSDSFHVDDRRIPWFGIISAAADPRAFKGRGNFSSAQDTQHGAQGKTPGSKQP